MKIKILATLGLILMLSASGICQPPPPPSDPKEYAPGNAPVGAPVGNGTLILITLAAAYALRKALMNRNTATE